MQMNEMENKYKKVQSQDDKNNRNHNEKWSISKIK